jgi:hypothetical protein
MIKPFEILLQQPVSVVKKDRKFSGRKKMSPQKCYRWCREISRVLTKEKLLATIPLSSPPVSAQGGKGADGRLWGER